MFSVGLDIAVDSPDLVRAKFEKDYKIAAA
jgi:hypothetical protein